MDHPKLPRQPLAYHLRLPDAAQPMAFHLLSLAQTQINAAITALWPQKDRPGNRSSSCTYGRRASAIGWDAALPNRSVASSEHKRPANRCLR